MPKAGQSSATEAGRGSTFQVSVLRSKQTGQVLFLEAGKDFVDLLLSFLLLPVGTIIHMLSDGLVKEKNLGGISRVFQSVKNLDSSLLYVDKQTLVEPRPATVGTCLSTGLLRGPQEAANTTTPSKKKFELPKVYYRCNQNCACLSTKQGARCNQCGYHNTIKVAMTVLPQDIQELEAALVGVEDPVEKASSSTGQGFVKESITYMVTDSLEIMPSTTIRSIKVLNKLKVATLGDLESSDITVSIAEVLQLLQSALTSSSCLNDVFGKK